METWGLRTVLHTQGCGELSVGTPSPPARMLTSVSCPASTVPMKLSSLPDAPGIHLSSCLVASVYKGEEGEVGRSYEGLVPSLGAPPCTVWAVRMHTVALSLFPMVLCGSSPPRYSMSLRLFAHRRERAALAHTLSETVPCSLGWPQTCHISKAGLNHPFGLCLLGAGTIGMFHHTHVLLCYQARVLLTELHL